MSAIPPTPPTGPPEPHSFGPRAHTMPDSAWLEIEKYVPVDAKNRMPLLRDWIEGAGSPGLAGDTELHLHLARAIILATVRNARLTDQNIKNFLASQAALISRVADNATTVADKIPVLQESIAHLKDEAAQATAHLEIVLEQNEKERNEHEGAMKQLHETITEMHRKNFESQITPILEVINDMPNWMDGINRNQRKTNRLILAFVVCVVLLPISLIIFEVISKT